MAETQPTPAPGFFKRFLHRAAGVADEPTTPPVEPTPIYISQRTRLILLSAFALGFLYLCMQAPSVPRLALIGATLALVLSFPVRLLNRWMSRGLAILAVMSSTVLFAMIGLILVIPFATNEISDFIETLPDTIQDAEDVLRDILTEFYERGWLEQNPDVVLEDIETGIFDRLQEIAENVLAEVLDRLASTFSILISIFGVIFVTTYLLIDIPRFREKFVGSFSPAYRPDAEWLWSTLGESLSRYLSGLLVSVFIQGAMVTIGLALLDIPYAFLLGVWMMLTAVLPYIGAFLGAIPSILIALTISWQMAVVVTLLYIFVNQVESNFITPRVQAGAVRVHPLLIFFSVIAGSQIAGPFGAILAVPTLAVARVLFVFFWERLRIRGETPETVLVALGGDDDEAEGNELDDGNETEIAEIDVSEKQDARVLEVPPSAPESENRRTVTVALTRRAPTTRTRRRGPVRRKPSPRAG